MKKTKIDHYTDKEALEFHNSNKSGKIEIVSSKPMTTKRDLALAYSPGVAAPVKQIAKKLNCVCDFYEPASDTFDTLINNKNILIKNPPWDHKYKITLGDKTIDSNFYNWAKLNPDKVRVSPGLLKTIYDKGYVKGKYLYLRDEKVLTLAQLFLGGNITRIDTIVIKEDVDK